MTLQDLKNRKSYIIAKITRIAGVENVKRYMDLMLFVCDSGFSGTVYELVMDVHSQLRGSSRKTNKVAEARARVEEATGIERKSYGEQKFGNQHNFKF
jgi:hypothetical protein